MSTGEELRSSPGMDKAASPGDWFYDSPPPKPAILCSERFMAARYKEGYYRKQSIHIYIYIYIFFLVCKGLLIDDVVVSRDTVFQEIRSGAGLKPAISLKKSWGGGYRRTTPRQGGHIALAHHRLHGGPLSYCTINCSIGRACSITINSIRMWCVYMSYHSSYRSALLNTLVNTLANTLLVVNTLANALVNTVATTH